METLLQPDFLPPYEWVTGIPEWCRPGQKLTISTRGPDVGRVAGIVQPAKGRFIGAGPNHGKQIPATYADETFADFHAGSEDFDDGGEIVEAAVGSLAIERGHSANVQASNVYDARDFLQRRGRWEDLDDDLYAYGKIRRVTHSDQGWGEHVGALVFLGTVYPGKTTRADARIVNTTTQSGENWPHPDHGGQLQFIGPARVQRTSFRNNMPEAMAATTDTDGPVWACWVNEEGEQECDNYTKPIAADLHSEATDTEWEARMTAHEESIAAMSRSIGGLLDRVFDTTDVTFPEQLDALRAEIAELSRKLVALEAKVGATSVEQPDGSPSLDPLTQTIGSAVVVG